MEKVDDYYENRRDTRPLVSPTEPTPGDFLSKRPDLGQKQVSALDGSEEGIGLQKHERSLLPMSEDSQ